MLSARWRARPRASPTAEAAGGPRAASAAAIKLTSAARRPVLYAGGGVVHAGAERELTALARRCDLPVATTLMANSIHDLKHMMGAFGKGSSWVLGC